MNTVKEHCFVREPLSLVLKMSRIHGVPPIHMESHGDAFVAQVSPRITVYSKLFVTTLNGLILAGFVMDSFYIGTSKGVRVRSYSALAVWLIDFTMVMSLSSIGVFKGPSRMQRMIRHLNRVEKVYQTLPNSTSQPSNNRFLSKAAAGLLLALYFIMAMDMWSYVLEAQAFGKDMTILYLYGFRYFGYSMILLLQTQDALIILSAQSALKALNNSIKGIINGIELKAMEKSCVIMNNDLTFHRRITMKQPSQKSVRDFADCYVNICNMVREVNDMEGMLLCSMFMSSIVFLFVSCYYLISDICSHTGTIKSGFDIILQFLWCIYRSLKIVLVIEPCHRTHEEMIDTQMLVSQMTFIMTPIGEPVPIEFNNLQKQFILSRPNFTPLNIFTLSRSLTAAITTGVSTYLIIIIQLRLIDECK